MNNPPPGRDAILVIGHRNPDTDAVCSAMAYAHLFGWQTGRPTAPCYIEKLTPETEYVLGHLGLAPPQRITDVLLRAGTVAQPAPTLGPDQSLYEARALMQQHDLRALAVTDADGHLLGMVELSRLGNYFIEERATLPDIDLPLARLRPILTDLELLSGDEDAQLSGHLVLALQTAELLRHAVRPGDIVVIGYQPKVQRAAFESGAGCLLLVDGAELDAEALVLAKSHGAVIARTGASALRAIFALQAAVPVRQAMSPPAAALAYDDLLTDGQEVLRESGRPALPVLDDAGRFHGLLLRRHLLPQARREIILTDHNHPDQAAQGVTESKVIAIVDHHNLGGLHTMAPLSMFIEPVGCTCTLIAEQARRAGAPIPRALAGAMLAAILSDTVQFRSPTTTPRDRVAAEWLAELSGESITDLALAMFRARLPQPTPPPSWWVTTDRKSFAFDDHTISISQIELVDVEAVMPPVDDLRAALAEVAATLRVDAAYLALTDIFESRSLLIADSQPSLSLAERAFGLRASGGCLALPGVMSRKAQIVPPLAAALTS